MPNRKPHSFATLLAPEALDSIARSSGLVSRHSPKFNAAGFVLALLGATSRGASSYNQVAAALAGFAPRPMSRQAMSGRLSPKSTDFLTNVPKDTVSSARLWDLYAQRWSIEIAFRAAKQSSNARRALGHKSSEHHIKALVLATALLTVLAMKVHSCLRITPRADRGASLEKTFDAFTEYVVRRSAHNLDEPFAPDPRHLAHDKRRRPTLWQSITRCLG